MDFNLTEEQRMLKDSVERFVADKYDFAARGESIYSETGYSKDNWRFYAEMGWLALPFEEQYGGLGGTEVDIAIVMEAFGRGLVLEPYLSTVVLGGGLINEAASDAQKTELIAQIAAGDLTLAFAYLEPQSRFNPADVETSLEAKGDGFVLNGHKSVVYQGNSANRLIASARSSGEHMDTEGLSLVLLDPKAKGVSRKVFKTIDGQWACDYFFDNVHCQAEAILGGQGNAYPAIEKTLGRTISALCAEAVGAMTAANEITKEYINTRVQFGVPIGSFQALQHRWVDMHMEAEMAKSMSDVLAMRLRDNDEDSDAMIAASKVRVAKAGLVVGQGATQLHGGIGMTNECSIGHYYKRLMMVDTLFGNQDYHATRYESLQAQA